LVKRLVAGFPPRRPGFDPGSAQVGFVDKVARGQVFSEYFGFPCQSSFHQLLHNPPHLSSGAGTIGQKWPQCKGLSPTPLAIKKEYSKLVPVLPMINSEFLYSAINTVSSKQKLISQYTFSCENGYNTHIPCSAYLKNDETSCHFHQSENCSLM
jgi:hypothetical protein